MVDGGKQTPLRAALIDRVVIEYFVSSPLARDLAELHACSDGNMRQLGHRGAAIEQANVRFLDQPHAAHFAFSDLNESCHIESDIGPFLDCGTYSITSN